MGSAGVLATRVGGHTFRYLTAAPRTGRVVSTFRHGFNVLFDEELDPGFVSIQTEGAPLHPWALEISDIPDEIRVGSAVSADSRRITLGPAAIHWQRATGHTLQITPYTPEEAKRARSRWPILARFLDEERAKRDPDPFRPEVDAILKRWKETGDSNGLLDLVGLGTGSTPSGDDVLVGLLSGFTAFERISDEAKASLFGLRAVLHAAENRGTSLPSAQMLAAAAGGSVSEPVLEVVSSLASEFDRDVRPAIRSLVSQGATSGLEMLAGILQALERLDLGSEESTEGRRVGHGL